MTPEQLSTMRRDLGLAEDADESTIVAALTEALAERADAPPAGGPNDGPTVPEGMTLIPTTALEDLQRNGQLGAQAAEQLRVQARESFLDSQRGKFPPARREAWAQQYDRDPEGTRSYLEGAPELIPTTELGHGAGGEQPVAVTDTDEYKNWSM